MKGPLDRRPDWVAAQIADTIPETPSARSLVLDVPGWDGHVAGQHVDVRLTAPDGYQAARSYSLSSAPNEPPQITVERVDDGEVSPYLVDIAQPGDRIEVLGPLGGYFVWQPTGQQLLLVAGGSGIAPLRSMWRAGSAQTHLVYSVRTADRIIFADEIADTPELSALVHLTREERPEYATGRIDRDALSSVLEDLPRPAVYVCGPTAFVESVVDDLSGLVQPGQTLKTERFG